MMTEYDEHCSRIDDELNALEGRDGIMQVETLGRVLVIAIIAVVVIAGWAFSS